MYIEALKYSKAGYSVILERDIDEVFINSYNPEWILAWHGNIDLQVCLDYFAVITYITEYFTKDDSGTMAVLIDAMKKFQDESLKEKMSQLMNTYISHRQMGEAEAVFKILPDLHFKKSNIPTVFVPNCPRSERSKFLLQVDEKAQSSNVSTLKVKQGDQVREGTYIERYDMISKYERRVGKKK